jgi:RNase P/RNase MRP subunit p30
MFDIVKCEADPKKFGFANFYFFDSVKPKLVECENVTAAEQHKNRKVLVMLKDFAFDEGAMKVIAEKKNVCFLIDLGRLMRSRGVARAIAISKIRTFLSLCNKFGALYAFASFSEKESELRTAEELANIALLFDINRGQAKFALKMIQHYL